MYNLKCIEINVTEWNETNGDWSGDEFSKGGFTFGKIASNKMADVVNGLSDYFYGITENDIFIGDDSETIQVTVQENGEAMQDDNGGYLADYFLIVEKNERVAVIV